MPTSYRPATKNIYAVSFIPLRLEISGRVIFVWGEKIYVYSPPNNLELTRRNDG